MANSTAVENWIGKVIATKEISPMDASKATEDFKLRT
jgi:hypothetical protein